MKKPIIIIVVLIVLFIGLFMYATRPVEAPSDLSQNNSTVASSTDVNALSSTSVYRILPSESVVEFRVGETLRGSRFIAVGTTSAVAGDVFVTKMGDTTSFAFGKLTVNAKTFKTDNSRRDGAIARFILKSEDAGNEFIVFVPKIISDDRTNQDGAKNDVFNITGDLTIAGVTKPVTFKLTLSTEGGTGLATATTLSGIAMAEVKRSDFNLTIPSVPFVADVDDVVTVTVRVVAKK